MFAVFMLGIPIPDIYTSLNLVRLGQGGVGQVRLGKGVRLGQGVQGGQGGQGGQSRWGQKYTKTFRSNEHFKTKKWSIYLYIFVLKIFKSNYVNYLEKLYKYREQEYRAKILQTCSIFNFSCRNIGNRNNQQWNIEQQYKKHRNIELSSFISKQIYFQFQPALLAPAATGFKN